jgi:hypothetical protein
MFEVERYFNSKGIRVEKFDNEIRKNKEPIN